MSPPPVKPAADEPRLRSFIAIGLADPARSAVVAYLQRLRGTIGGVAWTRPENLHVTLKFLGDVAAVRIPRLAECLRLVAAAHKSFTLRVVGLGAFPNLARPRTLWIGILSPELNALGRAVETICGAEGFAPEQRALRPHVTLGRVRASSRRETPDLTLLANDGSRDFGVAPVTDLVLFRSELDADGARHAVLATLPLASA